MKNFSFLSSLNENVQIQQKKNKLTDGIKYDEYEVELIDESKKTVFIPYKRTDIFESEINNTDILTNAALKVILRKCNGVTEI